jgi:hypothetical protein
MTDDTDTDPAFESEYQPVRLPRDLLIAADALVKPLRGAPAIRAYGRASRAAVLRLALARGLDVLRAELVAAGQIPPGKGQ